ncbi:extracellular serine proteinase-like [Saccoglossus kowalevskii]|uniref:Proprotein convertase subtilisin/kexin type 9-like n=1 Tax=Saccoglossus kowalevskii TaxID=10224 RepID=A0ABM0GTV9_SACKO|nr:PREDICTED: proprotein convertase subtilisin/kexin type 9-like [Saccoglossus kowalevskii]
MRVPLTLLVSALTVASVAGQAPLRGSDVPDDVVPDRYMVVLKAGETTVSLIDVAHRAVRYAENNGGYISIDKLFENVFMGFSADMDTALLDEVRGYTEVDYVEKDSKIIGHITPPHLDRIDQQLLPLDGATYEPLNNGDGVEVYIIDSGIMEDHEEFVGRVKLVPDHSEKCDFMQGQAASDAAFSVCGKHGTAMAGIVGGNTYGVAKGVTMWDVRVLTGTCDGRTYDYLSDVIHGMDMVLFSGGAKPAVVLIASGTQNEYVSVSYNTATNRLYDQGYVVVGAAGNARRDACNFLAGGSDHVFTVGQSIHPPLAPMDMALDGNYGACVDIFAPGYSVQTAGTETTTITQTVTGTSASAAVVAGAAAVMLVHDVTNQTPDYVMESIRNRATTDVFTFMFSPSHGSPDKLVWVGDDTAGAK